MRLFLTGILCILPFCSMASLRSTRPGPVLHSVFDKAAPPDLPVAPFFDPRGTRRSPTREQVHHTGNVLAITGACFLFVGLLAFVGAKMANSDRPADAGHLVLMDLSNFAVLVGGTLLVTGVVISGTHKPPRRSGK